MGTGGGASGTEAAGGGAAGGSGNSGWLPLDGSQLGMRGVSPPWPPFALEVPINAAPLDYVCAAQHSLLPSKTGCRLFSTLRAIDHTAGCTPDL